VNVTVIEINEDTILFGLYNSTDTVSEDSFTDGTRFINFTGLQDGIYYYNVTANDTLGNSNNTETRTITLDTTNPTITINEPITFQVTDSFPANVPLDYTTTDTNPDSCWYHTSQNLTNITITCNTNNDIEFTTGGAIVIYVYANDTSGNEFTDSTSFYFYEHSYSIKSSTNYTGEGEQVTFWLDVNMAKYK